MTGTELRISAIGVTIALDLDGVDVGGRAIIEEAWSSAKSDSDTIDGALVAALTPSASKKVDVIGDTVRNLSASLSTRVTLAAIELQKRDLVMLHACAVALEDGRTAAFVGPSGRGKTTLATALAQRFGYVTDETVGIAEDGTVHPYRKPLSVIDHDDPGAKKQMSPATLGLQPLPVDGLTIASIAVIARREDAEPVPLVEDMDHVDAIMSLVPELSYLPELERPLQRLAELIDTVGGVRRLIYRESSSVHAILEDLVARPRRAVGWMPVAIASTEGVGGFGRVPAVDGIAIDGKYLLLHGSRIVVLDGIGPAVWDALRDRPALGTVISRVLEQVGPAGSSDETELVSSALNTMVEMGIVEAPLPGGTPS